MTDDWLKYKVSGGGSGKPEMSYSTASTKRPTLSSDYKMKS